MELHLLPEEGRELFAFLEKLLAEAGGQPERAAQVGALRACEKFEQARHSPAKAASGELPLPVAPRSLRATLEALGDARARAAWLRECIRLELPPDRATDLLEALVDELDGQPPTGGEPCELLAAVRDKVGIRLSLERVGAIQ